MLRLLVPACLSAALAAQNTGIALTATVDGYVEVPYAPQLVPQSGITVEAWITYDDTTLPSGWRWPTVVRQGFTGTSPTENYFLRIQAGQSGATVLGWKVITQSGGAITITWPFSSGQLLTWTHVAATYDGVTSALYVDGALVSSAPGNGSPIRTSNNTDPLRIGKGSHVATPIEVWNGEIDEFRLWPFARTQAEILQTKDFQLYGVPGLVSTWNLDGHLIDTSSLQNGTMSGGVTFTTNPLTLTALAQPSATAVGAGTVGCGPFYMSFGSLPQAGNLDFAPVCTGAPANAATFLAMAFSAVAAPAPIAGIDFWLDQGTTLLVLASTDAFGVSRFAVPHPAWLPAGQSFAFQYGFVDPCGSQGVTASDALVTLTQ